jgi:hypothetical protein
MEENIKRLLAESAAHRYLLEVLFATAFQFGDETREIVLKGMTVVLKTVATSGPNERDQLAAIEVKQMAVEYLDAFVDHLTAKYPPIVRKT